MSEVIDRPRLRDLSPERDEFLKDVIAGLSTPQKTLPCKYLYDERGSELFEEICDLEEYYPTRTEIGILNDKIQAIAAALGPRCLLVEYGSGSSRKTRILLDHLEDPAAYVPIDISLDALEASVTMLRSRYPDLEVLPICADYHQDFELPEAGSQVANRCVFFPGSTIGNFDPDEATVFLEKMGEVAGPDGQVLIGVDLKKDRAVLEAAYDDAAGVTAAFNLNLLRRIRDELDLDLPANAFEHRSVYNADRGRVEMHLLCTRDLAVETPGGLIRFRAGETIHTENSYKFDVDQFRALAEAAGLRVREVWTDRERRFSVQLLGA